VQKPRGARSTVQKPVGGQEHGTAEAASHRSLEHSAWSTSKRNSHWRLGRSAWGYWLRGSAQSPPTLTALPESRQRSKGSPLQCGVRRAGAQD